MPVFVIEQRDCVAQQLLVALARREHAGRTPKRLLEPSLGTWNQLKGNLNHAHLLALVAEDAAVRFPLPADLARVLGEDAAQDFAKIPPVRAYEWLQHITPEALDTSSSDAIASAAKALGLPFRYAGANLHKLQTGTRVLELPGTGGQLVARAMTRSPDATLHVNCTILTRDWADRALAGVVAMEFDAPHQDFIRDDPDLAWATSAAERGRFDLVFGLDPDKGGAFDADTLSSRFPVATIVLV